MSLLSVTSEPQQYIVSKKSGVREVTLVLSVALLTTAEAAFSILVVQWWLSFCLWALKLLSGVSVTV